MIELCVISDQNYIKYVPALLMSISIHNTNSDLFLRFVFGGPSETEETDKIKTLCDLLGIQCKVYTFDTAEYNLSKVKLLNHVSLATMARLFIPEIVPKEVTKILYLDVDIIVQCDLREMYETDTGITGIAAKTSKTGWTRSEARKCGLELQGEQFNAGVLLLDLSKLRENKMFDFAMSIVENHKCNDQIALNAYCAGDHAYLDDSYNVFVTVDDHIVKDKNILHFLSQQKPWKTKNNIKSEFCKIWHFYNEQSIRVLGAVLS